jgi:hypothetical protein
VECLQRAVGHRRSPESRKKSHRSPVLSTKLVRRSLSYILVKERGSASFQLLTGFLHLRLWGSNLSRLLCQGKHLLNSR